MAVAATVLPCGLTWPQLAACSTSCALSCSSSLTVTVPHTYVPWLQNFDGSGGNGAALRHYEATGRKYPLVVKLGTLSPHGGDVYS
eukprot:scaffold302331_cov19-Tisochrysis_lutea.AAC.3